MQYTGLSVFSLFRFFLYLWGMDIPNEVLAAAAGLVEMYGPKFKLLGTLDGVDYYLFLIPENQTTGFPAVFGYKEGQAVMLPGLDAVDTMRSFGIE